MTDIEVLRDGAVRLKRRLFVGGALTAGLIGLSTTGRAAAGTIPPSDRMPFEVTRGGDSIGTHQITFSRQGARTQVDIEIDLAVTVAFITAFRYEHRNTEVWEDGRLIAIDTETNDDGTPWALTGRSTASGFRVDGGQGVIDAPADIIPSSYWNYEIIRQTRVLDTMRGGILNVAIQPRAQEQIETGGRTIRAQRYTISGDLMADVWYSTAGQWVSLAFDGRGEEVRYRLRPGGAVLAG